VEEAMRRADVAHLAARAVGTLSGGERQRARVARALAQDGAHPGAGRAHRGARRGPRDGDLRAAARPGRSGKTVLLVTHNLNLAARYADRLVLLEGGRVAAEGAPAEVLTRATVERVYGWPVEVVPHPGPGPDAGAPQVVPLAGEACAGMERPDVA
jgi:iron complex transport system ATP-binding protein